MSSETVLQVMFQFTCFAMHWAMILVCHFYSTWQCPNIPCLLTAEYLEYPITRQLDLDLLLLHPAHWSRALVSHLCFP